MRQCMWLKLRQSNLDSEAQILSLQTRRRCAEKKEGDRPEVGGTETPMPPPQPLSGVQRKKKVRFQEPDLSGAEEGGDDEVQEPEQIQQCDQRDASEPYLQNQEFLQDIWLVE